MEPKHLVQMLEDILATVKGLGLSVIAMGAKLRSGVLAFLGRDFACVS